MHQPVRPSPTHLFFFCSRMKRRSMRVRRPIPRRVPADHHAPAGLRIPVGHRAPALSPAAAAGLLRRPQPRRCCSASSVPNRHRTHRSPRPGARRFSAHSPVRLAGGRCSSAHPPSPARLVGGRCSSAPPFLTGPAHRKLVLVSPTLPRGPVTRRRWR